MFVAMKLFALLAAVSDPVPGPPQAVAALRAATEGGAQGARLGDVLGRIAPGFKADLTLIDTRDPTFSPMNSVARQLVHIEAGRGVRHVIVDGKVVVRDRQLSAPSARCLRHKRRCDTWLGSSFRELCGASPQTLGGLY